MSSSLSRSSESALKNIRVNDTLPLDNKKPASAKLVSKVRAQLTKADNKREDNTEAGGEPKGSEVVFKE